MWLSFSIAVQRWLWAGVCEDEEGDPPKKGEKEGRVGIDRAVLERAKGHDCIPVDDVKEAAAER